MLWGEVKVVDGGRETFSLFGEFLLCCHTNYCKIFCMRPPRTHKSIYNKNKQIFAQPSHTHAHTHKRIDTYLCAYILWADYVDVMWNLLQSSDKVFVTLDFIVKWLFEWLSYCFIYILHMCWRSMRQSFSYNWLKILSISAYVVVPLDHKFDQNYKRLARVRLG